MPYLKGGRCEAILKFWYFFYVTTMLFLFVYWVIETIYCVNTFIITMYHLQVIF